MMSWSHRWGTQTQKCCAANIIQKASLNQGSHQNTVWSLLMYVCLCSVCLQACTVGCFPVVSIYCLLLHIKPPTGHKGTLTLQIDKCALTTLREMSTWSLGSLQGKHFYSHLHCLVEQTLNLLHDLWLRHPKPFRHSVLYFSSLVTFLSFPQLSFYLIWFTCLLSPQLPCISIMFVSMCYCERPLQEC